MSFEKFKKDHGIEHPVEEIKIQKINDRYDNLLSQYPQKRWFIENCRNAEIMLLKKKK